MGIDHEEGTPKLRQAPTATTSCLARRSTSKLGSGVSLVSTAVSRGNGQLLRDGLMLDRYATSTRDLTTRRAARSSASIYPMAAALALSSANLAASESAWSARGAIASCTGGFLRKGGGKECHRGPNTNKRNKTDIFATTTTAVSLRREAG